MTLKHLAKVLYEVDMGDYKVLKSDDIGKDSKFKGDVPVDNIRRKLTDAKVRPKK